MVYIIYKNTNYQNLGRERLDVGLCCVEEKYIETPKDYALFGAECCTRFLKEDVFFDDKVGAYRECAKRNKEIIDSLLTKIKEVKNNE